MDIVDRRLNPGGKSLSNRQRFMRRQAGDIREAIKGAIKGRKLGDEGGQEIDLPNTGEPSFRRDYNKGMRDHVVPGNIPDSTKKNWRHIGDEGRDKHIVGDKIQRPPGGWRPGAGSRGGEGEDNFKFILNHEEFIRLFLEDMELPDLFKESTFGEDRTKPFREGYARYGSPQNLDLPLTAQNALARRIALKRPNLHMLQEAQAEVTKLLEGGGNEQQLERAILKLDEITKRHSNIPYFDPVDQRFRRYEQKPAPSPQAVMFCMMDVSGSMDEFMKDLAKRFFLLLNIFLKKRYKRVDMVFIRHTHYAKTVDEDTFFNSPESGGTIVSTALEKMQQEIKERYSPEIWNIYGAQVSDGQNGSPDDEHCLNLLTEGPNALLKDSQYFAYVEVENEEQRKEWDRWLNQQFGTKRDDAPYETSLWSAYKTLLPNHKNFAMQHARQKGDVWKVFEKLFRRDLVEPKVAAIRELSALKAG